MDASIKPKAVVGLGVVLVWLIGYHGIHVPSQAQVRQIRARIAEEQLNQQAQAEAAALMRRVDESRNRVSPDADPSWLAKQVLMLGQEAGVQVTTITQAAPEEQPQFTRLAVDLQFTASYHQLGEFLDQIERADSFIYPEQLQVSREGEGQDPTVRLTLSTLYLPSVIPSATP